MTISSPLYLNLYTFIPQTRVLGFDMRFALWVQGCPFNCTGCITPDAIPAEGGQRILVNDLVEIICNTPDIEGITLTGGEPFAQAEALSMLVSQVKNQRDLGVVIYSGFKLHVLQHLAKKRSDFSDLLSQTDVLVDGLYEAHLNDGLSLRGSSNQKIHVLSSRYESIVEQIYNCSQRPVEIHLLKDSAMLVGIPGEGTLKQWQSKFK